MSIHTKDSAEQVVKTIWKEILKVDDIDSQDNFFDLGGTSLSLISVVMKMSQRFGVPISPGIVASGATVASLAAKAREILAEADIKREEVA